ncbi:MAG: triple tyrosine motif-containing protein [Candidatus Thermoplasmatota archaeon]
MKKIQLLTIDIILVTALLSISSIGYIVIVKNNKDKGIIDTGRDAYNETVIITHKYDYIDDQPPVTIIVEPTSGDIEHGEVTIKWRGEDDYTPSDDLQYSYYLDGLMDNWSVWCNYTSKTFILSKGEYVFMVRARDLTGNIQTKPTMYRFTIINDTANPDDDKETYSVNWHIDNSTYVDDVCYASRWKPWVKNIKITPENIKTLEIQIKWIDDYTSRFLRHGEDKIILTLIKNKTYERYYGRCDNNKGSIYFISDILTLKPDNKNIQAESIEEAYNKIYLDNKTTWPNHGFTIKISCLTGEIRPVRRLIDRGNLFSITVNVTYYKPCIRNVDTTPPDTILVHKPDNITNNTTVYFEWIGSDNETLQDKILYRYKLLGYNNEWSTWSDKNREYYNINPGLYTFIVQARDEAGNMDPSPAEYTFIIIKISIDNTPPETFIVSPQNNTIHYNNVTVIWNGQDNYTPQERLLYSYKLEPLDDTWSDWSNHTRKRYDDLHNGSYTFLVKAKDEAGNVDPTPAVAVFNIRVTSAGEICRYATSIKDFNPGLYGGGGFPPENILGGPRGGGRNTGSTHVVVLGLGGSITVGFNVSIVNDDGPDFIVFENPFYIGSASYVFAELVYVEVSTNGVDYARFPCRSTTIKPVPPFGGILPGNITGLAGVHPVYANVDENNINPFNPAEAGGDAFDLSDISSHPLVLSGRVDLNNIRYVRVIDIIGDGSCFDDTGHPIYDALGGNGADIDAVAVINYRVC